ncbi:MULTISPECIES: hypothetical protein [Chryseobacterium]|uniref:hypothetical protein n=1 Tax=Chryseobacterium TaxID=59732 RepID=UPI0013C4CE47|nr:hypothetical protein [Chryseobacterium aurantiacum]
MIQLILILLGITLHNGSTNTANGNQTTTMQSSTILSENLDTGGETIQTPPKK